MIPAATLAWLERELGPVSPAPDPLPGETSHTNHRILAGDRAFLLRSFTDAERLRTDPWYSPHDEIVALEAIAIATFPAPSLVTDDRYAEWCEQPTIVLTWVEGSPPTPAIDRDAFVRGLAEHLPAIHRVALVRRVYEPYFRSDGKDVADLQPPPWARDVRTWERAFEIAAGPAPEHAPRFIHRDYHEGNTLWRGDRLTGIIDWTTGSSGPIGIDLAQMRMNLAFTFDLELGDAFLEAWRSITDDASAYHPYWEVLDCIDWLGDGEPDDDTPEQLRRFETFVARAVAELG